METTTTTTQLLLLLLLVVVMLLLSSSFPNELQRIRRAGLANGKCTFNNAEKWCYFIEIRLHSDSKIDLIQSIFIWIGMEWNGERRQIRYARDRFSTLIGLAFRFVFVYLYLVLETYSNFSNCNLNYSSYPIEYESTCFICLALRRYRQ